MIIEIRAKLPCWYFVQLQCFNSFIKSVFNVAETLNIEKMSLIMVECKADLASVRVFG